MTLQQPLWLAEGAALMGTEKSPVMLYIVITVWRELGKENENGLQAKL